ncbi:MAG TPA: HD domain-containing phosphohydrolase [Candidatus Omnitrophota bacterium]|nr:HD domain-containing protein [Candidatus Omnitrophota bacterium]HNQ50594.1 HD domain-containing phosphohydrolase [Candidatus Omnitrophota bacterium]HQO38223.1 HD domain-containing phosphohydrolase [Candidatus Omnitrophota bacterium]HQQ06150.1 HD domain-containing phosphohydrolase [Candidatus Omnitrophota bacterium]
MLSILQILKKYQDEKQKLKDQGASSGAGAGQSGPDGSGPAGLSLSADAAVSVFNAVNREIEDERLSRVREFYSTALDWARRIYSLELKTQAEFRSQFVPFAQQAVGVYNLNDKNFLFQCLHDYEKIDDYIYCHAVNVAFMSVELGRGMNYTPARLTELFCAAFMHDIGIMPFIDLVRKPGVLAPEEYARIKEHPLKGLEILNQLGGEFSPGMIEAITQEHERTDGSGYPKGLREGNIGEFAQIVCLADVYEALTHSRPHRKRLSPPKAVNEILDRKNIFSVRALKMLLERIGIFPVGTWVRLNTKETGIVFKHNHGLPLRPAVQVLFAENGAKLLQPKLVDLASNLLISIEECLENQYNPR